MYDSAVSWEDFKSLNRGNKKLRNWGMTVATVQDMSLKEDWCKLRYHTGGIDSFPPYDVVTKVINHQLYLTNVSKMDRVFAPYR